MTSPRCATNGSCSAPLWTGPVLPAGMAVAVTVVGSLLLRIGVEHRFRPEAGQLP